MKEKLKTLWIESFESNNLPVYKLQTNFIICILQHIYLSTSTNNSLGEQSSVIFNILFGNCEGSNCRHFDVEIIWNFIHFYQYPSSRGATQQSTPTVFVLVSSLGTVSVLQSLVYICLETVLLDYCSPDTAYYTLQQNLTRNWKNAEKDPFISVRGNQSYINSSESEIRLLFVSSKSETD